MANFYGGGGASVAVPGSGSTVDSVARASAASNKANLQTLTAEAGETIAPGQWVFAASKWYINNTASSLTVPASITQANMTGAGFEEAGGGRIDNGVRAGHATTFATMPSTRADGSALATGDFADLLSPDGARQAGRYVWNGAAWAFSHAFPSAKGLTETVVLASLPADTWTNIPVSTAIPVPVDFRVFNAAGDYLDLNTRIQSGVWQIISSTAETNLQIKLEG